MKPCVMGKRWKRSFGIVLFIANIAWGQNAVETELYLSFNKKGPIAIGKVASVHAEQQSEVSEVGTVSLDITQQLRGEPLQSHLEIQFGWTDPNSSAAVSRLKGPPPYGFDRVRPLAGMNVLLIFERRRPTTIPPMAVLDLDTEDARWVPLIKRAIGFSSLKESDRVDALLLGLDDPQKFIRVVSMHQLRETTECQSGSTCADRIANILGRRAKDGNHFERSEAIGWLDLEFYDATAGPTGTNTKIAQTTLALVADPDPSIRGQAIDNLDLMLSPDAKWGPDLAHLAIPIRYAVAEALRQECQKAGQRTEKARRVSAALGVKQ